MPGKRDYLALGSIAMGKGDYQEAVNIYKRALKNGPPMDRSWAYEGIAEAFEALGEHGGARWAYNKALALEPENQGLSARLDALATATRPAAPERTGSSPFKVGRNFLTGPDGRDFFIKGINLGLGLPGHYPGEFSIAKGTYLKWFPMMERMGFNTLRTYTVHPPHFYEALREYNDSGGSMYLLQGVWAELAGESGPFGEQEYTSNLMAGIDSALGAVFGSVEIPPSPGKASGAYRHDVSHLTAAFIVGREWEGCPARELNNRAGDGRADYRGSFLSIRNAQPFERWVTAMCDYLLQREQEFFGIMHPVSTISWPTLDPLKHPSESRYEDDLRRQGMTKLKPGCSENEDVVSLDAHRIKASGGAGFFATYHAYPYYPDFLNNDYLAEAEPYLAYLRALKALHGRQPVLVAEFGVPSSRDVSHWHRLGWHQGGHDEPTQAAINAAQMDSIARAGMAGGAMFHWFDEWFKRNWVFAPYELPAGRNAYWYNAQDAEQNYGLMATYPGYPGKAVTLTGSMAEWEGAEALYSRPEGGPLHAMGGTGDGARTLRGVRATHDEGYLYLLIECAEEVDFTEAHYLVGLDTCGPETGEFTFSGGTGLKSPVGMKFMVEITGPESSRILICRDYDKYLNSPGKYIKPRYTDQASWVMMMSKTNNRRTSKDGRRFFSSKVFMMSPLSPGSLKPGADDFNSLADFNVSGRLIELRLPWGLINFTDPSSHQALWMDSDGKTRTSTGIGVMAATYRPAGGGGRMAVPTGGVHRATDHLPLRPYMPEDVVRYNWKGWDTPIYHMYLKEGHEAVSRALKAIPGAES